MTDRDRDTTFDTKEAIMHCRICGCEKNNIQVYLNKGIQALCNECALDTPRKVSRESFCKAFFGTTPEFIQPGILREFYHDYLTSTLNLKEYCERCSTIIDD